MLYKFNFYNDEKINVSDEDSHANPGVYPQ